ncbi:hypothetical protein V3N99_21360 [Dermatophilaceae bacterium Soc4.6]
MTKGCSPGVTLGLWPAVVVLAVSGCATPGGPGASPAPSSSPSGPSTDDTLPRASTTAQPTLKDDPVDSAFHTKVDSFCTGQLTEKLKHQYPVGYVANDPDQATLAEAGAVLEAEPLTHTLVVTAKALGKPRAGAAAWASVVADFGAYQKGAGAAATAAKAQNPPAFVSARDLLEGTKTTILNDMRAAGFGATSPCALLFASAGGH